MRANKKRNAAAAGGVEFSFSSSLETRRVDLDLPLRLSFLSLTASFLNNHHPNTSGAALIPVLFLSGLVAAIVFRQAWGALVVAFFAAATAAPAGVISQRFRHARVWDCWRRYFGLRAAVPEVPYVDPSRRYIVVQTPHSVFPMG